MGQQWAEKCLKRTSLLSSVLIEHLIQSTCATPGLEHSGSGGSRITNCQSFSLPLIRTIVLPLSYPAIRLRLSLPHVWTPPPSYSTLLPPSSEELSVQGLNLLRLLVQNRIAEFHTELELIPPEVSQGLSVGTSCLLGDSILVFRGKCSLGWPVCLPACLERVCLINFHLLRIDTHETCFDHRLHW